MAESLDQLREGELSNAFALVAGIDKILQAATTRIANRSKNPADADDIRLLIECRAEFAKLQSTLNKLSRYGRS